MLNSHRIVPLVDLWLNNPDNEGEVRIGRIVNGSFQSGISKGDFDTMYWRLRKYANLYPAEMKLVMDKVKVVDSYYVNPAGQQVRVREYVDSKRPEEVSIINTVKNLDVCTDGPYGMRFAIKSETKCDDDAKMNIERGAPTVTRGKTLYVFQYICSGGVYKYELCEVVQVGTDTKEGHEAEIEAQRGTTKNPMPYLQAAGSAMIASVRANYKQAPMITRVI